MRTVINVQFGLARKVGLDAAVFTTFIKETAEERLRVKKRASPGAAVEVVVVSGMVYIPFTAEDLSKELPFWTKKQIRRVVQEALNANLIKTDNFNIDPRNRRLWYAVVPDVLGDGEC